MTVSEATTKTVLIADDHPVFRLGLKQILAPLRQLRVVAEAESGDSALKQIRYLAPDFALLDLAMPGMDGLHVLEQALVSHPALKVIIVTSYDDPAYMERALELGASGYLVKDSAGEQVAECFAANEAGEVFVSPSLGRETARKPQLGPVDSAALDSLTPTERTVLMGVASFLTSKEIARDMEISYRTVQNHRANIAEKLDLKGRHQLVRFARANREALDA